jgi:phenylacetate-CoA ligase
MNYNSLLEKVLLPLGDFCLQTTFIKDLKQARKLLSMDKSSQEAYQKEQLSKVLHHAVQNVSHYRDLKINKNSAKPLDFLKSFPVLEKADIKARYERFIADHYIADKLIKAVSSGSSGEQTTVYFSKKERSVLQAIQILWWEVAGYKIGDPLLQTGITPERGMVKSIKDYLFRTTYIPAFNFDEKEISQILKKLEGREGLSLAGYASSLYVIAEIAEKHNHNLKLKRAISWGDKLFDHYREKIKIVFGAETSETYACVEGLMMGAQMDISYMYLMSPFVYLELLDDDGNEVADGEIGHVVATSLLAYAMPLIRYKLGDLAVKLPKEEYPEKRKLALPLLKKVIGRDTDIVKTASGKRMIVHSFTGIFEHIPQIKQFRVVQESIDEIRIEYIAGEGFSEEILKQVEKRIHEELKESFPVKFKAVDQIKPTASGKPQIIKSFLKTK